MINRKKTQELRQAKEPRIKFIPPEEEVYQSFPSVIPSTLVPKLADKICKSQNGIKSYPECIREIRDMKETANEDQFITIRVKPESGKINFTLEKFIPGCQGVIPWLNGVVQSKPGRVVETTSRVQA